MSQNFQSTFVRPPPPPPPMQISCISTKVNPPTSGRQQGTKTSLTPPASYPHSTWGIISGQETKFPSRTSDSLLVATVDGKSVGGGPGVLYSSINGNLSQGAATTGQGGTKVNPNDPQVRKLVYNMYRGLLSTKHERANNIVGSAPQEKVITDEGVGERVLSMMRQQADVREGKMMNLGPPPPPPPPPFSTGVPAPAPKPPVEVPPKAPTATVGPPAALAGAMMKDRKPFTYTPGGLNLAEIKSPRMQRRLQRNASMEGVRPSPLAQQPAPPTGVTATIPPHGMIQVLPVPGMGMGPVVKPQPKEPPKPKRNVCGPAPPPPPFVVSSESSGEPSPSSTPAATPAINSATPPTTPSAFSTSSTPSSSFAPVANGPQHESDNCQLNNDKSGLQPIMASEPGPSVPTPPPPPPSCVATRKRFSYPSSSSPPSSPMSKPGTESPVSTIPSPQLSKSPVPLTQTKPNQTLNNSKVQETVPDDLSEKTDSSTSLPCNEQQPSAQKQVSPTNESAPSAPQQSENDIVKEESSSKATSESPNEVMITLKQEHENQEPENKPKTPDSIAEAPIKKPENNSDITDKVTEQENDNIQNSTENQTKEVTNTCETIPKSSSPVTVNSKEPLNTQPTLPKEDDLPKQPSVSSVSPTPKNYPAEDFSTRNMAVKPTSATSEHTGDSSRPFRPMVRMASPPATLEKENKVANLDRLVRQASLPAEPTSSPSVSKPTNKGSLYISPVKTDTSNVVTNNKTASSVVQNSTSSPTSSGLNKAPLPWMCGIKKEPSPPPEFLAHAQKAQERLQRQRSLPQRDIRQEQSYEFQKNEPSINSYQPLQNDFPLSSAPYSAPTAVVAVTNPPQVFKNTESVPTHTWRSPAHQTDYMNQQQQRQYGQQQQQYTFPTQPQPQQFNVQQPRFLPQSIQQQNHPRERIIPIMLEESPPATPSSMRPSSVGNNFMSTKLNQFHQPGPQRQGSWNNSSSVPASPMGTGGAFSPYESQGKYHSSSNALEALQQMQQNLAQLNSGLQTAYPRVIHQKLHLNLSPSHPQFSAQNQPQQNGTPPMASFAGSQDPVAQSRSFKVLQNAYDNQDTTGSDDELWNYMQRQPSIMAGTETQDQQPEDDFHSHNAEQNWDTAQKKCLASPQELVDDVIMDPKEYEYSALLVKSQPSSASGGSSHSSEGLTTNRNTIQPKFFRVLHAITQNLPDKDVKPVQELTPEPKKYTGSSIPSRSFRMLQAMTDNDDVQSDDTNASGRQGKSWADESTSRADSFPNSSKSNNLLSSSSFSSSSSLTPSTSSVSVSSDILKDTGSRVAPSYTNTSDSHVYRHVVPKIMPNAGKQERVVNSALSARRDSSPRPWQRSSRDSSPVAAIRPSSLGVEQRVSSPTGMESPSRLLNILKQETALDSGSEAGESKLLYGGSSIPSRVFRQLQNDYSDTTNDNSNLTSGSPTPSSPRVTEVQIPRIMQQLQIDQRPPSNESAEGVEELSHDEVLQTASAKESVLKELTSQFDPQTNLKKPKAAPGRVFRYLQQQYDDPQDSDFASIDSNSNSPSNNASPNNTYSSSTSSGIDSGPYEIEPKPYGGCRIPGRTFRLLQENIGTHPSVLQARK